VFQDKLASAYLSFAVLAFIGALVNAWSRISVIRELKHEMRAAARAPLSHNAHNEHRVAPQVELAFLERRIHHLKVVGLTLVVESVPFAALGFSKLYRYNLVQNHLLQLVSCGVSAFWVGSKITRLIGIPEYREKAHRLEEDAQDQADWTEFHAAKKGRVDNAHDRREHSANSKGVDEHEDAAFPRQHQHEPFSKKMIDMLHGDGDKKSPNADPDGQVPGAAREAEKEHGANSIVAQSHPHPPPPSLAAYVQEHRPRSHKKSVP
jgi:hypothetical protein